MFLPKRIKCFPNLPEITWGTYRMHLFHFLPAYHYRCDGQQSGANSNDSGKLLLRSWEHLSAF